MRLPLRHAVRRRAGLVVAVLVAVVAAVGATGLLGSRDAEDVASFVVQDTLVANVQEPGVVASSFAMKPAL